MTARSLPSTGAVTGLKETLDFFRDPQFAQKRFTAYGEVFETRLLNQRLVLLRGEQPIADLFAQGDALEGWWPESVRQLLGNRSLANRSGEGHKARRRVVGQLFSAAALSRYTPSIAALVEELAEELIQAKAPVQLVPCMRRFAFAVIATTVLREPSSYIFSKYMMWPPHDRTSGHVIPLPEWLPQVRGRAVGTSPASGARAPARQSGRDGSRNCRPVHGGPHQNPECHEPHLRRVQALLQRRAHQHRLPPAQHPHG